jgi:hypothetical protein
MGDEVAPALGTGVVAAEFGAGDFWCLLDSVGTSSSDDASADFRGAYAAAFDAAESAIGGEPDDGAPLCARGGMTTDSLMGAVSAAWGAAEAADAAGVGSVEIAAAWALAARALSADTASTVVAAAGAVAGAGAGAGADDDTSAGDKDETVAVAVVDEKEAGLTEEVEGAEAEFGARAAGIGDSTSLSDM